MLIVWFRPSYVDGHGVAASACLHFPSRFELGIFALNAASPAAVIRYRTPLEPASLTIQPFDSIPAIVSLPAG